MLDVTGFAANPAAPELGGLGICYVRYGKAMRGSPPRQRAVATVMPWAAEALAQYIGQVRPCYEASCPALWLTERAGGSRPGRSMTGSRPGGLRPGCQASCQSTACGMPTAPG